MLYHLVELLRPWLIETGLYHVFQLFDQQLEFRVFGAAIAAFAIMVVAGKPFVRWLLTQKIGDQARFDVAALDRALASKANTPTMGGLLIAGAIFVATVLFADLTNPWVQMGLVVLAWHAAVGGIDDWLKLTASRRGSDQRQGLRAWEKLAAQVGIGVLIGYFAWQVPFRVPEAPMGPMLEHAVNLPFQKTYLGEKGEVNPSLFFASAAVYTAVMVLMMAGLSNAVNITDGMDGLASGVAAAVAVGLMVLAFIAGFESNARALLVPYVWQSAELAIVAGAILGACLGFLWFNASPASVFMGDTGSLCLGGMIGYIAVALRQEFVVLLMCAVFLWEIISVVIQVSYFKSTKGKRVFRCAPYHWHLHMGGWPETKIVARAWIVTVIAVAVALGSIKLR